MVDNTNSSVDVVNLINRLRGLANYGGLLRQGHDDLVLAAKVIEAVTDDIKDARHQCGGDGEGCKMMRGYYPDQVTRRWRKCGQCPMEAMVGVIDVLGRGE